MKRTIKNTIAVIGAIAMFSTTGAMLPSAEVYGAPAQTAAVLVEANNGLNPPALREYKVTANSATLSWKPVSGAIGYRIYRKVGSNWVKVKTLSGTRYTEKGLAPYSSYQYKVKAYKKKSGKTFWGKASRVQTVTTLPEAPKFKAFSATKDSIRVNWQGVKCDGYQLYGTYKIKNLKSGTKYTFKLRAYGRRADTNGVITSAMIKKSKSTQRAVIDNPEYGTVTFENMDDVPGWEGCDAVASWKGDHWSILTYASDEALEFAKPYIIPDRVGKEGESFCVSFWVYGTL